MEDILRRHHQRIAAVVVEPLIQGASGMRVLPNGFLKETAHLCRRYGVHLIADEVATGFGRTGTLFAVEQENVRPDFLCVAKSMTGGYLPLAATLTTERIYRAFLGRYDEFKTFFHGHTYTANPLACAAALANLKLYKTERLLANVQARSRQMREGLAPLAWRPHVKEIRQVGLMAGIELVADKATGKPYPPQLRIGLKVCDAALRGSVWLRPLGDVIPLVPPLAITELEMDFLLLTVRAAILKVTGDIHI
jgi:adenosylmethionine-8-amino-7-oxononanoate aminotransferase